MERLTHLMDVEQVYRDPDISVQSLSNALGIRSHQLSALLKTHMETSFRAFINKRRVEEARSLLISRPDKSVLDIAFTVGFNSKTTFNTAFLRETGESPTSFRVRHMR